MRHIPRFYVNKEIIEEVDQVISPQQMFHATKVLRLKENDVVRIFNSDYGEWECLIKNIKKNIVIPKKIIIKSREEVGPGIACSLINPNKFLLMLEKITELGVQDIYPLTTDFSQYKNFNRAKAEQVVIQACEQSKRLTIPKIHEITIIQDFVDKVSQNHKVLVGLEKKGGSKISQCLTKDAVFLVGPEGGFSDREVQLFDSIASISSFYFGRNILRSETAAIAFVSLWVAKYL